MKPKDILLFFISLLFGFLFIGIEFFAVLIAGEIVVEKIEKAIAILRGLPLF